MTTADVRALGRRYHLVYLTGRARPATASGGRLGGPALVGTAARP